MGVSSLLVIVLIVFVAFWLVNTVYYQNQRYEEQDRVRRAARDRDLEA